MGDDQLLANPGLDLLGCPTNNAQPETPYAVTGVPGWQATPGLTFGILGRDASPPLVMRAEHPDARLFQSAGPLRHPFTVTVVGAPAPPGSSLVLEWKETDTPGEPSVVEDRRPLVLRGGEEVFTISPPPSARPLFLEIGLEQELPESDAEIVDTGLTIDRVELLSSTGQQRLRNPGLDVPLCTPAPMRPAPASVSPPWIRWILTAAILIPLALFFRWLILRWKGPRPARWVMPISGRARIAFLVAIALAPLVSVGTVKLGVRVVLADWIFLGARPPPAALPARSVRGHPRSNPGFRADSGRRGAGRDRRLAGHRADRLHRRQLQRAEHPVRAARVQPGPVAAGTARLLPAGAGARMPVRRPGPREHAGAVDRRGQGVVLAGAAAAVYGAYQVASQAGARQGHFNRPARSRTPGSSERAGPSRNPRAWAASSSSPPRAPSPCTSSSRSGGCASPPR